MQWGIDGSRHAILAERRQRIKADHLVFVSFAPVDSFELLQPIEIKQRKSGILDRSEIAAAALDRQNTHRLSGKWIRKFDLRAGVAAPEICDP